MRDLTASYTRIWEVKDIAATCGSLKDQAKIVKTCFEVTSLGRGHRSPYRPTWGGRGGVGGRQKGPQRPKLHR